jgi:hypothetical protein
MRGTLEQFQNADGGWPYGVAGPSWTEPTAFALLAQVARGEESSPSVQRGLSWLQTVQSADGGWRPEPSVEQSTWVGALVALLPGTLLPENRRRANLKWLLQQTGQESTRLYRIRQWMIGHSGPTRNMGDGWPWYPGAAAWVTPTALTILALGKHRAWIAKTGVPDALLDRRIEEGQRFLLAHACASGGWNHGGAQALGYQANPYPETTGLALLALRDSNSPVKDAGIRVAERFLPECRSAEGIAWLSLGLGANGRSPRTRVPVEAEPRTIIDLALLALVDRAQAGIDSFVS